MSAAVVKKLVSNLEPHMPAPTAFIDRRRRDGVADGTIRRQAHMVMAGTPIQEVARMLGGRVEMVGKVYAKHSPDYLRRAAGALVRGPRIVSPT